MLSHKKSTIERYLEPLVNRLSNVNPNSVTLVGSIPSLVFFVCMIQHWYIAALVTFVGSILDLLDGMVARKFGKSTAFGGFLDSFIDRISDFFIITAFSFSGIVRWEITAPLLLFAYLTSYARSRGELANTSVSFAVGFVERTERIILIVIALLFYILVPGLLVFGYNAAELVLILTTGFSLITVFQRVLYAYKNL